VNEDLIRALGSVEGKLDILLQRAEKIEESTSKLTDRVSKLEHESTASKTAIALGAGLIATAAGAVGAMADRLFK
jgi:hypothetical protein